MSIGNRKLKSKYGEKLYIYTLIVSILLIANGLVSVWFEMQLYTTIHTYRPKSLLERCTPVYRCV